MVQTYRLVNVISSPGHGLPWCRCAKHSCDSRDSPEAPEWQAYRCAVYLLRRVVNEPIAKVARRAAIPTPRVSQIQAEVESAEPQGPMRMLLDYYKVKR
jgi:hypothetical protein